MVMLDNQLPNAIHKSWHLKERVRNTYNQLKAEKEKKKEEKMSLPGIEPGTLCV